MIPTIIIVSVVAVGIVLFFVIEAALRRKKREKLSPERKETNDNIKMLYKLAKKGDGEAYYKLYIFNKENSWDVDLDVSYAERQTFLERAATLGYPQAQYEYGKSKVYRDCAVAVTYLEKAAEAGIVQACWELARIYDSASIGYKFDGFTAPDEKTCRKLQAKWLKIAAESGDTEAQASLGHLLFNELDDKRGALEWFEKAAEKGEAGALVGAARIYNERGGYDKAFRYFSLAAEQDYTAGQYWLGRFYLEDYAFDKDKALFWLNKAAEKDELSSTVSMGFLAELYEKGEVVEADPIKAEFWRKRIEKVREDFKKRIQSTEAKAEKDLQEN